MARMKYFENIESLVTGKIKEIQAEIKDLDIIIQDLTNKLQSLNSQKAELIIKLSDYNQSLTAFKIKKDKPNA